MLTELKQKETPAGQPPSSLENRQFYDALILDAWTRQALSTIRSLGKRGLRVAALTTREMGPVPALSSRWCQRQFICPAREATAEYLAYLQNILATTDIQVIIPTSDGTIELIRQHRASLEQYTKIALAAEPALASAVDKEQTLSIASSLGLAIPKGICLQSGEDGAAALREVGLPAVAKPARSWDNSGEIRQESKLVTTPAEALAAIEQLTREGCPVLFQQFIPGDRESISLMYAQGKVYACFAHHIQRTNPPLGGTDVLRASIAPPADIAEQAERLVQAIDLEGYSLVEFRRDLAGVPYLMEINSRLSAGVELPIRTGVDFPYLCYQWATGQQIDTITTYRAGYRMRDFGSDIATTLACFVQHGRPGVPSPARAIYHFCLSFFRSARYDYVDFRDLRPTITAIRSWFWRLPQLLSAFRSRKAQRPSSRKNEPGNPVQSPSSAES